MTQRAVLAVQDDDDGQEALPGRRAMAGGDALPAGRADDGQEALPDGRDGRDLAALLAHRRSVRRLRDGPFPATARHHILRAATLTPAAYNRPPWHIVLLDERRAEFWHLVEQVFRERLDGDRLERYLARLRGFRGGVAVLLVYEDRQNVDAMRDAWRIDARTAHSFADQGLGMVQLALWLAVVAEGLATSLQHWEDLIADRLVAFLGHSPERFVLAAVMPVGYAAEEPRAVERPDPRHIISLNAFGTAGEGKTTPP